MLGGYVGLTTAQLWNICHFSSDRRISVAALRIYLAAAEMLEKRCKTTRDAHFTHEEVIKLTGLKIRAVVDGLRELRRLRLLEFSTDRIVVLPQIPFDSEAAPFDTDLNRIVPIPRRMMRLLCSHSRKSEIVVALVHCARGLFKLDKKLVMKGAVRASWITEIFGIGKTAIHATRAWLRSHGFIAGQHNVEQWRRNRWGYYFEIRCGKLPKRKRRTTPENRLSGGPYKRIPFNKLKSINQYSYSRTKSLTVNTERKSGFLKGNLRPPNIKNIQLEDLRRVSRLLALHRQAVEAGWIERGEANLHNFVAAAVRSTRVTGDSVRIFVGITRKRLWHHITVDQEAKGVQALKNFREKMRHRASGSASRSECAKISDLIGQLVVGSSSGANEPIRRTLEK